MPVDQPAQALRQLRRRVVAHRRSGSAPGRRPTGAARRSAPAATADRPSARRRRRARPAASSIRSRSSSNRVPTVTGSSSGAGRAGHRGRVEPAGRPRQLLDHAVGQQLLGLLAAGPQRPSAPASDAGLGEEVLEQRGLADPGRALDLHDLRPAGQRVGQRGAQHRQLGWRPTNGAMRSSAADCPTRAALGPGCDPTAADPYVTSGGRRPTGRRATAPCGTGALQLRAVQRCRPRRSEHVVPVGGDLPDSSPGRRSPARQRRRVSSVLERNRIDDADADAGPDHRDQGLRGVDAARGLHRASAGRERLEHLRRVPSRRASRRRSPARRSAVGPRARPATPGRDRAASS